MTPALQLPAFKIVSSYSCLADNPIMYTDIDGDIVIVAQEADRNKILNALNDKKAFGENAFKFNDHNQLEYIGDKTKLNKSKRNAIDFLVEMIHSPIVLNIKLSNFTPEEKVKLEYNGESMLGQKETGNYSEIQLNAAKDAVVTSNIFIDPDNLSGILKSEKTSLYQ